MAGNKCPFGQARTQLAIIAKGQPKRRCMRAKGIIRTPFIFPLFGLWRRHAGIGKTAPIMLRPTIIGTKFGERQIIRHHIGAQHVAFVYHAPQTTRFVPIKTNGVTHTNRIRNFLVLRDVIFQHHSAAIFGFDAIFANIAVRPHRDVDFFAIG